MWQCGQQPCAERPESNQRLLRFIPFDPAAKVAEAATCDVFKLGCYVAVLAFGGLSCGSMRGTCRL